MNKLTKGTFLVDDQSFTSVLEIRDSSFSYTWRGGMVIDSIAGSVVQLKNNKLLLINGIQDFEISEKKGEDSIHSLTLSANSVPILRHEVIFCGKSKLTNKDGSVKIPPDCDSVIVKPYFNFSEEIQFNIKEGSNYELKFTWRVKSLDDTLVVKFNIMKTRATIGDVRYKKVKRRND